MVAPCRLTCLMCAQISGSRSRSQSEKVLELGGRHAAKLHVFHDGTPHRFAECHHGDRTDYFFAVLAGSAFAGLAALAVLPFSSVTITSISLSPVFSGKWVPAALYCASPAFTAKSCFFPSGKVNVPLASVRNTATVLGWLCITDFSCGP